jgi:hypothetical protein
MLYRQISTISNDQQQPPTTNHQQPVTNSNQQQPTATNSNQQQPTATFTLKMSPHRSKLREAISMFMTIMIIMKAQLKSIKPTKTQIATATAGLFLGAAALAVTMAYVPCATYTAGLLSCII